MTRFYLVRSTDRCKSREARKQAQCSVPSLESSSGQISGSAPKQRSDKVTRFLAQMFRDIRVRIQWPTWWPIVESSCSARKFARCAGAPAQSAEYRRRSSRYEQFRRVASSRRYAVRKSLPRSSLRGRRCADSCQSRRTRLSRRGHARLQSGDRYHGHWAPRTAAPTVLARRSGKKDSQGYGVGPRRNSVRFGKDRPFKPRSEPLPLSAAHPHARRTPLDESGARRSNRRLRDFSRRVCRKNEKHIIVERCGYGV